MKYSISRVLVAAMFAATAAFCTEAAPRSKSIIIESPSSLPEAAQHGGQAMYLHTTRDDRAILYVEQDQGRTLAIFDVSDPANIKSVAKASIAAPAGYDFVRAAGDSAALIHYRDHSGFALINFKQYKQPVLVETPQMQHPAEAQPLGNNSFLLTSASRPSAGAQDPEYQVVDASNPSAPAVLADVKGVQQTLVRVETGTLFLLGDNGLTVVRRPNVEQDYLSELTQHRGN